MSVETKTRDDNRKPHHDLTWTREDELLLKEWADKATCFHWLHENSYKKYERIY
jgi:hypothetical protein